MRIACPFCSAAYDVPAPLLREPRMVRCAQCSREWLVGPISSEPARTQPKSPVAEPPVYGSEATRTPPAATATVLTQPPTGAAPRPAPDPRPASFYSPDPAMYRHADTELRLANSEARRPSAPVVVAWVASVAVLLLLAWAAYTWRSEVMDAWPPSQRLYAALGLKSTAE
jgi:predicted Zn finger-like uncharacterized protein